MPPTHPAKGGALVGALCRLPPDQQDGGGIKIPVRCESLSCPCRQVPRDSGGTTGRDRPVTDDSQEGIPSSSCDEVDNKLQPGRKARRPRPLKYAFDPFMILKNCPWCAEMPPCKIYELFSV